MNLPSGVNHELPTYDALGRDLLATSRRQRWAALARPYLGVVLFAFSDLGGLLVAGSPYRFLYLCCSRHRHS
jgi:hypothetical protein